MEDLSSRIFFNFIEHAQSANQNILFNFSIDEKLKTRNFRLCRCKFIQNDSKSVNNAMKYANAHHIVINAEKISGRFKIEIKDDGKGFDTENVDVGNWIAQYEKNEWKKSGKFFHHSEMGKELV